MSTLTEDEKLKSRWKYWHWVKARSLFHLHDEDNNNFAQISSPDLAMYSRARSLVAAAPRLLAALEKISDLPAGSQGAYGKFKDAQDTARKELTRLAEEMR